MEVVGIIASVVQIADVGLRLSIKLYTFGEIVASADRSVISISKDVSLTSGVLKELGQLLDKDKETGTFSETAVQTADGVVKECLEVFKEMDKIIVKRLPSLGAAGKEGGQGERAKRAMVMLERLKWGYLQPKLELLRSNLDSLKSTLLLMLNVITYARQVFEKAELPSVIAEQKCLIEDLAQSNQEYILKFERLKLGIEEPAGGPVDDASKGGVVEMEPRKSLSGTLTRKLKKMKFAIAGTSLQDKESTRGLGSEEFNKATWPSPKAQSSTTGSLATPPNADTDNININTSVRGNSAMPPVKEWGIPTTEAPMASGQEALFKQLKHHSMLIKNLLKEVDEAQYKITFKSRLRMKGGIAGLHEEERRELEKMYGFTALQSAEQRLDSLMEGIGELPRVNTFAPSVTSAIGSPYVAENFDTPRPFKEEPVAESSFIVYAPSIPSAIAMPHPASIGPSSTYARDTTHRTDFLSSRPSLHPVHQARLQFFAKSTSPDSNMPRPALILESPSDKPTVTRARRTRPTSSSPLKSMRRAEIAKAKAEEQRKSSTIRKRKDSGDRIGGYTEPHQEEDDTGDGGVDMATSPSRPYLSQFDRSENIWTQGTDSAASNSSVPRARSFTLHSLIGRYRMSSRSYRNNARLHPQPRNDVDEHGANAFDDVDEGDTEELVGKRANGDLLRDDGDSTASSLPARQASALLAPAPQAPAKFQPQIEQGDSQLANEDLVDRLISLWTTVKP